MKSQQKALDDKNNRSESHMSEKDENGWQNSTGAHRDTVYVQVNGAWKKRSNDKEQLDTNATIRWVIHNKGKRCAGGNKVLANSPIQKELMAILEGLEQACKNNQISKSSRIQN